MSSAQLATTSDTLVWLAVLSYAVAGVLFGLEFAYRLRWLGVAGLAVTVAGLAANLAAATTRGLAVHRVPWGNMYEFSIIVGIVTVTGFLIWVWRQPEIRPLGVFVLLPAVLAMALGGLVFRVPAGPLVPALNSRWIVIHVAAAITGSSVLCLAAVFSILYLVKERVERRQRPPAPPLVAGAARTADRVEVEQAVARHAGVWDRLPSADTLDHLAYRTAAFGFPSGPSPSSPGPSGPSRPGAATGAGTPRRRGRSSAGPCSPPTCTPGPPPAGAAAAPPGWPSSAWPPCCSTSTRSTPSSSACTATAAARVPGTTTPPTRSGFGGVSRLRGGRARSSVGATLLAEARRATRCSLADSAWASSSAWRARATW
jgi:ABC-type transport system involved in cytochrome c biogenesis permease subunit